jgi:hypothetical protein
MAAQLGFTVEPDEVALVVTKRWLKGYFFELGPLKTVFVFMPLQMLFFVPVLVTDLSFDTSKSASPVFFFGGLVGSLVLTFGVLALLLSRRFVVSNRRIVDCGGLVSPQAWMLPLGEIGKIKPFYNDESSGEGRSYDFKLRGVYLWPRSGEEHMVPLSVYHALILLKLVPEELRRPFPGELRN